MPETVSVDGKCAATPSVLDVMSGAEKNASEYHKQKDVQNSYKRRDMYSRAENYHIDHHNFIDIGFKRFVTIFNLRF